MELKNSLQKLGLTATESEIYLKGLEYEQIEVSQLVKQTNINRTTIYHALETLMRKGLVAKTERPDKLFFSMTNPSNIQKLLDEKIAILKLQKTELNSVIPLLTQITKNNQSLFKVTHYEGIEGIKLVTEESLYCKSSHWDIIAPVKNFFSEFDKDYSTYFVQTRKRKGITTRSLWEPEQGQKNLTTEALKERNPRILPKIMHGKFKSVINIFDDKVAIISSLQEKSAIIIQSQEFKETMSAIFEGLWLTSKPIKK